MEARGAGTAPPHPISGARGTGACERTAPAVRVPFAERLRPTPSGAFTGVMGAAFAYALWQSFGWTWEAARLPWVVTIAGLVLVAVYTLRHLLRPPTRRGRILDIGRTATDESREVLLRRTAKALGTTIGLVTAIWLIGFQIAVPTYVWLYLRVFGGVRWWVATLWAIVFIVLIYGFFDLVIHIAWIDPVLEGVLPDVLKGRETITEFLRS